MEKERIRFEKYMEARKRVDTIKSYYAHLVIYIVANALLFIFKARLMNFFISKGPTEPGFIKWIEWNIIFIPLVWGSILLFCGLYLFLLKPGFFKNWEQRQLEKFLEEDE